MPQKQDGTPPAQQKIEEIIQSGKGDPANATPAHEAAEADMLQDPDFINEPEKGDELDEGELAQLEGEN